MACKIVRPSNSKALEAHRGGTGALAMLTTSASIKLKKWRSRGRDLGSASLRRGAVSNILLLIRAFALSCMSTCLYVRTGLSRALCALFLRSAQCLLKIASRRWCSVAEISSVEPFRGACAVVRQHAARHMPRAAFFWREKSARNALSASTSS